MNIFREFFERQRRHSQPLDPHDIPQDILSDFYNDKDNDNGDRMNEREDLDFSHHGFGPPTEFLSEVEEVFDNFFKGFGVVPFLPFQGGEIISQHEHDGSSGPHRKTLQEKMLKSDEEMAHSHKRPKHHFAFEDLQEPEGKFSSGNTITNGDRDLDEDLRSGEKSLDDILPRGNNQPTVQHPGFFSFSSSVVTRNQDGTVETRKTIKDSSGNEEVTITRNVDGKEYTTTHKKDEYGNEVTREDGNNDKERGNHHSILKAPSVPEIIERPSLYNRIRDWFNAEND